MSRSGWDDARRQLSHIGASQEDMLREIGEIEDEEAERNRKLKQQLSDLQASRRRREVGDLAANHTANLRAMETLFHQQTENLARMIDGAGGVSPLAAHARAPAMPFTQPAAPPSPQLTSSQGPQQFTPRSPATSFSAPTHDHVRRALAAEAASDQLRRELHEAREEIQLLRDEVRLLRDIKTESDHTATAMQARVDSLAPLADALGGGVAETKLKALISEMFDAKMHSASAKSMGSPVTPPAPLHRTPKKSPKARSPSPAGDEHLRIEVKRLKAQLQERSENERLLNRRIQQLAKTPYSQSQSRRPLKFT